MSACEALRPLDLLTFFSLIVCIGFGPLSDFVALGV